MVDDLDEAIVEVGVRVAEPLIGLLEQRVEAAVGVEDRVLVEVVDLRDDGVENRLDLFGTAFEIILFGRTEVQTDGDRGNAEEGGLAGCGHRAGINDVELLKVPLTDNFDIDIETTKALLGAEQIKLTFICSPNNPTGNVFCQQKIETILQTSTGIVVIDEAYIDFSSTKSLLSLIDRYPNLVVLQTMSKARGLAAARVGFAFAARPIIELLNKVKPPYNVSLLNQQAALAALNNETDYCRNLQEILAEKETLYNFLEGLSSVQEVFPSAANFLLVRFNDADLIYQRLIKRKIIVRNRNTLIRNCIRITVGSSTENQLLMNELKQLENEKSIVY